MHMTQKYVDDYLLEVHEIIGEDLGVRDSNNIDELHRAITAKNPNIGEHLTAFENAYRKWWDFQVEHDEEMKKDALRGEPFRQNMDLMAERSRTREELLEARKNR